MVLSIIGGVFTARAVAAIRTGVKPKLPWLRIREATSEHPSVNARMPDGKHIFVVRTDGTIRYAKPGVGFGHDDLAQGQNVLTAGELKITGGKVTSINPRSGHYQPSAYSLWIAKLILRYKGMWAQDAKIVPGWTAPLE